MPVYTETLCGVSCTIPVLDLALIFFLTCMLVDVTIIYVSLVLAASDRNLMYYTLDVCMPRNMEAGGSRELCALWHGLQV